MGPFFFWGGVVVEGHVFFLLMGLEMLFCVWEGGWGWVVKVV